MNKADREKHWEQIYQTKQITEFSWYQESPEISLNLIKKHALPLSAKIIDVGGGDSYFVDHLLKMGYRNITVLDISSTAIERAKNRLGSNAGKVKWIQEDISAFKPQQQYDFWHDRAAFHFLIKESDINHYMEAVESGINMNGILAIGTFSMKGPKKCSGLEVSRYSESSLTKRISDNFRKSECFQVDHKTPFNTIQNFIFCSFTKIS